MKSGVRMNFLERRLYADRALSQLIRMARDATPETLSSREQRGVFRLESMLVEKSSAVLSARAPIGSSFAVRWKAFSLVVFTVVHHLWQKGREHRQRALAALWWARAVGRRLVARRFTPLRAALHRAVPPPNLRAREDSPPSRPRDPGSIWLEP
jgi:hypothetical protein